MAVVIRLQRAGARNAPFYRVVVCDSRRARDGRFIEKLGYYNPRTDPVELLLETPRIQEWVGKGARLSETVTRLLKRFELQRGKPGSEERTEERTEEKTEAETQTQTQTRTETRTETRAETQTETQTET